MQFRPKNQSSKIKKCHKGRGGRRLEKCLKASRIIWMAPNNADIGAVGKIDWNDKVYDKICFSEVCLNYRQSKIVKFSNWKHLVDYCQMNLPRDDTVTQDCANDGQLCKTASSVIFLWTKHFRPSPFWN
jgi:hypothetical protein